MRGVAKGHNNVENSDANKPSVLGSPRSIDQVDRPWPPDDETSDYGPQLSPGSSPLGVVLVIRGDPRMVRTLQRLFTMEGYEFRKPRNRRGRHEATGSLPVQVISIDLNLSDISGHTIWAPLKQSPEDIPLHFLAAVIDGTEKAFLVKAAEDGRRTKPFDQQEFLVQLQAAIRQSRCPVLDVPVAFGNIGLNFASMRATKSGKPVALTALQFKLIRFLLNNPDRVITRQELLSSVWERNGSWSTRTVDNQILKLRQGLEDDPSNPVYFCTVHGVGYRFVPGNSGKSPFKGQT